MAQSPDNQRHILQLRPSYTAPHMEAELAELLCRQISGKENDLHVANMIDN